MCYSKALHISIHLALRQHVGALTQWDKPTLIYSGRMVQDMSENGKEPLIEVRDVKVYFYLGSEHVVLRANLIPRRTVLKKCNNIRKI